jgi:hypothetical protein
MLPMTHRSESTNVFTDPIREARIWSTNETSSVSVSDVSLILISVGITDQLYLHLLDKRHVLAASLSGNSDKIRPFTHGGKLLIRSKVDQKREELLVECCLMHNPNWRFPPTSSMSIFDLLLDSKTYLWKTEHRRINKTEKSNT